jgi:site-specific DNA-methyltransferase (adenine-specific)
MRTKPEQRYRPGEVRDAIFGAFERQRKPLTVREIIQELRVTMGEVPASSVRSYLNLNTPFQFERVSRGKYALKEKR